jgi:hypothetical protein
VLLMGASPAAVTAVRALVAPLAPDAAVTVLPIADKHYSAESTYSLYQRYALPDDSAALANWLSAPPAAVWAITPPLPPPGKKDAGFPLPTLLTKAGASEDWLRPAAEALSSRLADYFAITGSVNVSVVAAGRGNPMKSSAFCIATATNCGGGKRSRDVTARLRVLTCA